MVIIHLICIILPTKFAGQMEIPNSLNQLKFSPYKPLKK